MKNKDYIDLDIGHGATVKVPKRIHIGHGAWVDNPDVPKNIKPKKDGNKTMDM